MTSRNVFGAELKSGGSSALLAEVETGVSFPTVAPKNLVSDAVS